MSRFNLPLMVRGVFDKLFKHSPNGAKYADMLNGYMPIFSQFGDDIYASDVVQQAISCIVQEMKKLTPKHVREMDNDFVPVRGSIQNVLDNPNPLMTTSEFLEKVVWQLFFNYNSFIIPTYYVWTDETGTEKRYYDGLYPIAPTFVEFVEDAGGRLYVHFRFANTYETTIRYEDVIHIRYNYSVNEYMGGNDRGQPDHDALLKTLQINNDMLNGVSAAMKSSFALNGVVKYNTMMDDGKTEAALKELERKLKASESGFLPLDLKADFTPLQKQVKLVDKDTLEFIDKKILRHFGVSLPILTGDYTKEQYEAFYQKTLEPLIIAISQAFTKKVFTHRQRLLGNKIMLFPKNLIFMTTAQKLEMGRLLGDRGALYDNEMRVMFGLSPLPELVGIRKQSLNYVDVNLAAQYQVGADKKEDTGEEKQEEETDETEE